MQQLYTTGGGSMPGCRSASLNRLKLSSAKQPSAARFLPESPPTRAAGIDTRRRAAALCVGKCQRMLSIRHTGPVRLKKPGDLQKALDTLDARARELRSLFYPGQESPRCRADWLRWWELADSSLREVFADDDLVTPLYRTAQEVRTAIEGTEPPREVNLIPRAGEPASSGHTIMSSDPAVMSLLNRTRDVWVDRLETAACQLRQVQSFVNRGGPIAVLDTSAFLEGRRFHCANWPELLKANPPGNPQLASSLFA